MLSNKKREELRDFIFAEIDAAEKYFDSTRAPEILKKYNIYEADKQYYKQLFQRLGDIEIVSKDVANTIEWALPSLMRVFAGTSSVISIQPVSSDDIKAAEINQKLLDFQLQTLNNSAILFYRWFKDALISSLGVVKVWWHEENKTAKRRLILSPTEYFELLKDKNIQVLSAQYTPDGYVDIELITNLSYRSYPKIAPVPPWEFLYSPKCLDIHESPFICHRKEVTIDFLRRKAKAGIFDSRSTTKAIQNIKENEIDRNILKYELQKNLQMYEEPERLDTPAAKTVLYENYLDYDINGDGLLEPIIVTTCNDQILRIEENTFGSKPFFGLAPVIEPYQPEGKSYADIIGDIQDNKTALIRQIILNIALNNNPRLKVQNGKGVNITDIINNKQIIRMNDINAVQPIEPIPLAPWTFSFLELLEGDKENRTGITRYNQGLDARTLNKTATGITKIMEASQQRLELIARLFAETGIRNLMRFMVGLNQRFIKQEQVIRVTEETLRITPDDLQGDFDFVIEPTALLGEEEKRIRAMQQALDMSPVFLKLGFMSKKGFYNLVTKYYQTIGLRAVKKYIDIEPQGEENGGYLEGTGRLGETTTEGVNSQGLATNPEGIFQGGETQYQAGMEGSGFE